MTNTVDRRVVDMQFNNQQFEQGVQTSVKSLDTLKTSLNFAGAGAGLSSISEGVQNISGKFSALGAIGFTVIQNITNALIDFGEKAAKAALGIDSMREGFSSYEVKINATKTVMAGTGESIQEVTRSLDELNVYSDRTIYSFQDMTENISKFTNAGLSSKDAATAIQGISNVAAISGASTQEAARAMYNFGQAMQQGSVRLMDWKSIENANMATIGFKQQLLDTAVALGTLEKQADGTYKVLGSNEVVSATKNFNGSLEKQWLTTKVLTSTLADYASTETEIGKKANAAATEVTTFTQLMSVAKDSMKTGWTKTWSIVFGDLNEAKALYTEISTIIGNFIGSSAKSRNEMLEIWKFFGGRTAIIDALRNAFNGVLSIIAPIREAFAEIIPPFTSNQLIVLSFAIRDLTAKMTLGSITASNLHRTFKGVAAVIDLARMAVTWLVSGLFKLVSAGNAPGTSFLFFTGSIGDWLVKVHDAIKYGDALGKTFGEFKKKIQPAIDILTLVGKLIAFVFSTKPLSSFNLDIETNLQASLLKVSLILKQMIEKIKYDFRGVGAAIGKALGIEALMSPMDRFKAANEKLSKTMDNFVKKQSDTGDAADKIRGRFEPVITIFKGLGSVLSWMGQALGKLWPVFSKIGSAAAKGISGLGKAIMNSLDNLDYNNIFDALNTGLFAALVVAFKKFMEKGSGTLDGISGILGGVKDSLTAWQSSLKAKTLMTIATAIGILAISLIALSLVDPQKLTVALAAISAMFVELSKTMEVINSNNGKNKALDKMALAGQMIAMSAAILLLAIAVRTIAGLKAEELIKGLVGIGVILTELALFMKVTNLEGMGTSKGAGLLLLAIAINLLGIAVSKFGKLDPAKMQQGLIGIGAVLGELALFTKITGDAKNVIATALGLTILGAAMLIFSDVIAKMGSMPLEQIGKGLLTMGGSLLIVAGSMRLMPKNMLVTSIALVGVAAALVILSKALKTMGGMSWENIAKGLVALGGSMLILVVGLNAMDGALPGAAAMLVMAAALAIFVPVLQSLGDMSLEEIGTALLMLAGTFAVIGIAGLLLGPITPVLIALAGAMFLFGLACTAVGVGTLAFSAGLSALAIAGTAGATAIALIITTLISLIPLIVQKLVDGIVQFAKLMGNATPELVASVVKAIEAIIAGLVTVIPDFVNAGLELVTQLLKALALKLPDIIQAGMDILLGVLKGIRDNIKDAVVVAGEIIVKFIEGITESLPKVIEAAANLLVTFLNGISDALDKHGEEIVTAGVNIAVSLIKAIIKGIGTAAQQLIDALGQLLKNAWDSFWAGLLGTGNSVPLPGDGLVKLDAILLGSDPEGDFKMAGKTALKTFQEAVAGIADSFDQKIDLAPTIRPVIDLEDIVSGGKTIDELLGDKSLTVMATMKNLSNVANLMPSSKFDGTLINQQQVPAIQQGASIQFTQINNSPTALSRLEIYRQTRNQLSALKGLVVNK